MPNPETRATRLLLVAVWLTTCAATFARMHADKHKLDLCSKTGLNPQYPVLVPNSSQCAIKRVHLQSIDLIDHIKAMVR